MVCFMIYISKGGPRIIGPRMQCVENAVIRLNSSKLIITLTVNGSKHISY